MDLVESTRSRDDVYLGVSPRGALTLYRCAQAMAFTEGRDYVVPDDIKRLAVPVFSHRVLSKSFRQNGRADTGEAVIEQILSETRVPV
jgi:MoxR-like ATPase